MTRSQTIALLATLSSVLLLAGLVWRAHGPDNWVPRLPFAGADLSREMTEAGKTEPAAPEKAGETTPAPQQQANVAPLSEQPAAAPPGPKEPQSPPQFDVVRVEPTGEAVIAGRGRPGDKIRVVTSDKVLAEALADASGQFVVTPTLPPGDYELKLRDTDASVSSDQSVTVSIGRKPGEKTVAALIEPGKPTVLLTAPADAKPPGGLSFLTADVERRSLYATGTAAPNAQLRIYADDKAVAEVTAGPNGHWSMRAANGLRAGAHKLRADSLDALGKVVARAEIPFEVPAMIAEGKTDQTPLEPDPRGADGSAIVQRGDTLWRISRRFLGNGLRYTQIFAANNGQIRNPNLIYPGQVLALPQANR